MKAGAKRVDPKAGKPADPAMLVDADSVKLSRVRIHNLSGRTRRLSLTAYVEWALGPNGTVPGPYVVTLCDPATGALFARNAWRAELGERIAFADLSGLQTSWTLRPHRNPRPAWSGRSSGGSDARQAVVRSSRRGTGPLRRVADGDRAGARCAGRDHVSARRRGLAG